MIFKEIAQLLGSELFDDHDHGPSRWMDEDVYSSAESIDEEGEFKEEFKKLGKFEMVDGFGGEGQGNDYYKVYHFIDHDVYIKFQGWYQSYNGSDYSEMFEVRPKEVTVTKYNRV